MAYKLDIKKQIQDRSIHCPSIRECGIVRGRLGGCSSAGEEWIVSWSVLATSASGNCILKFYIDRGTCSTWRRWRFGRCDVTVECLSLQLFIFSSHNSCTFSSWLLQSRRVRSRQSQIQIAKPSAPDLLSFFITGRILMINAGIMCR